MISSNAKTIQKSFTEQAKNFETKSMSFTKQEYLEHMVSCVNPQKSDTVLEVAAGTCICEKLPFSDNSFDIVISRLAFHHFQNPKRCFSEMARVVKTGGKLVVIDMEAAEEALRNTEDEIEALRDPSHMRNLSKEEFTEMFRENHLIITAMDCTEIPVSLSAWLALTNTSAKISADILKRLEDDINGGHLTGFRPYQKNQEIYFNHRWLMMMGVKTFPCTARMSKMAIMVFEDVDDELLTYFVRNLNRVLTYLLTKTPHQAIL